MGDWSNRNELRKRCSKTVDGEFWKGFGGKVSELVFLVGGRDFVLGIGLSSSGRYKD